MNEIREDSKDVKGSGGVDVFSTLLSICISLSKSKIQRRLREADKQK